MAHLSRSFTNSLWYKTKNPWSLQASLITTQFLRHVNQKKFWKCTLQGRIYSTRNLSQGSSRCNFEIVTSSFPTAGFSKTRQHSIDDRSVDDHLGSIRLSNHLPNSWVHSNYFYYVQLFVDPQLAVDRLGSSSTDQLAEAFPIICWTLLFGFLYLIDCWSISRL